MTESGESKVGYIYIAVSAGLAENVCKVGATTNSPLERARQLSASTSSALPFVIAYSRRVANPFQVETSIHNQLEDYRVNESREFFNVPIYKVITLIEKFEEAPELYRRKRVETPFAELFAKFPDDGEARELTTEERLACGNLPHRLPNTGLTMSPVYQPHCMHCGENIISPSIHFRARGEDIGLWQCPECHKAEWGVWPSFDILSLPTSVSTDLKQDLNSYKPNL